MQITVLLFGQLADVAGRSTITVERLHDSNALVAYLHDQYPALAASKYSIAVDKKIVRENTPLNTGATVALLPPFSGG